MKCEYSARSAGNFYPAPGPADRNGVDGGNAERLHLYRPAPKKFYVPAIAIIAAVLVLLVLIGVSTFRNLDREKRRAFAFVHRQGVSLLRAIEAGVRAAGMTRTVQPDTAAVLFREIARSDDVAYLCLLDRTGRILHHAGTAKPKGLESWIAGQFQSGWVNSRLARLSDGTPVYEIGKLFSPKGEPMDAAASPPSEGVAPSDMTHRHTGDIIVVGMTMKIYDAARQSDLHHALIMAGIVAVVGSGVLFFIFIIQNYYLVDRTLRQNRDYTRQILESMGEGLVSIDRQGRVVSCNAQASALLGWESDDLRGKVLSEFLSTGVTELKQALAHCRPLPETEAVCFRNGAEKLPLGISVAPITDDSGATSGAVLLIRDLREIRRLEEKIRRSEKLAATGKLAAGIAHEIRNPLSSVRGFAQFLHHALKDRATEREYAAVMVAEMDRINRVVSDLLSFASPKLPEPAPCDIGEIVSHVSRLVRSDAEGRNIRIVTDVGPTLDRIEIDGYQITQALLNLILNALKFTEPGGTVRIRAERDVEEPRLILSVEDDGAGIPARNLPMLFDPFFTTHETGTGLGLAIVHNIVENHRGEIDVESPPAGKPQGSRFVVRIPLGPPMPV